MIFSKYSLPGICPESIREKPVSLFLSPFMDYNKIRIIKWPQIFGKIYS
jgi:hypothetical protein